MGEDIIDMDLNMEGGRKETDEEGKEIKSEMITIEFFTDANKGATLQEGVYTIEHKFEPMYALPGYMMFNKADILYTWYGDKRSDDETGATDISYQEWYHDCK